MRILVVSPIASHPQNQGNSARIYAICRQLQTLGHLVHFLYYPLEGLTEQQREEMSSCWDYFHTLPCDLPNSEKSLGDYYAIDDWFDPKLGCFVKQLHERWKFEAAWVNYVWFSAILDYLPDHVHKIIDTHDVFGDRHLRFTEIGLVPEWFYTTKEEELTGLTRADTVVAIQDEEAAYFLEQLAGAHTKVTTIGHALPPRFTTPNKNQEMPIVGYLGSGNPFNVSSLYTFSKAALDAQDLSSKYRFVLAGTICDKFAELPPFDVIGRIEDLDDFYRNVDITINPMNSGTGLKIKTLEALSYGKCFIGTPSALVGIKPIKKEIKDNTEEPIATILEGSFTLPESDAKTTFTAYCAEQSRSLSTLLSNIQSGINYE